MVHLNTFSLYLQSLTMPFINLINVFGFVSHHYIDKTHSYSL